LRLPHLVAAVLIVVLAQWPHPLNADPLKLRGNLPVDGGVAAVTWDGGPLAELQQTAVERGCTASTIWVFRNGDAVSDVPGAPAFVNAAFAALFRGDLPPATILVLVCEPWHAPASVRRPATAEPIPAGYSRSDWRHWVDADKDCQDTRQEVLIAESRVPVTFDAPDQCRVASGEWFDPYTGTVITNPGQLDVDHMVPLQNAHQSGAADWSKESKQAYANDLDDPQHLIAVTAAANRSKGAQSPEFWKPPRVAYWCHYAVDWITIKDRWSLTITDGEWSALVTMLATCADGGPAIEQ
jgi:hypothetical protein